MNHFFRLERFSMLSLAIVLSTAGCHAKTNQAGMQDLATDPAAVNLAPDSNDSAQYASNCRSQLPAGPSATGPGLWR